jgi:hypothetical protein
MSNNGINDNRSLLIFTAKKTFFDTAKTAIAVTVRINAAAAWNPKNCVRKEPAYPERPPGVDRDPAR